MEDEAIVDAALAEAEQEAFERYKAEEAKRIAHGDV